MQNNKSSTFKDMKKRSRAPGHLLYAVDEHPPWWMSALLGLQLVLLIVGPITITPVVVARVAEIDPGQFSWIIFASLVASGIGTFVQVRRVGKIGAGYLLFIGSSGAFIACSLAAAEVGGMSLVATMAVLSAPLQILFGLFLGPLRRIITPLVGGVIIMLIVVSVLGIALDLMSGQQEDVPQSYYLLVSVGTLVFILLLAVFGNRVVRLWSLVLGIFAGTLMASFLGMTDFSGLAGESWAGLPSGSWPGFSLVPAPEFLSIYLAFALVTIVGGVETLGDSMAIQKISQRNFRKIDYERVQGAIYADGTANAIAGALGTIPNTTYSNAIPAVELTGVSARRVGYCAALILVLLAFSPKMAALIAAIPSPVIGAFLFVLLSMLFVTGIKLAASHGLNYESGIIIGVSFWTGYAFENQFFFPDMIPEAAEPFMANGMAMGGLAAILLSLLFHLRPAGQASFVVERNVRDFTRLQNFINEYASARKIAPYQLQKLHLTAEELFAYLCASEEFKAPRMQVNLRRENRKIYVEFIDSSSARDLDFALEALEEKDGEVDPAELGLLLLGKYAENIRHIKIGGINYISFELPDEE